METITLQEAATHLGISTKTARRWVKVGRLAATLEPGEHGPEYRVAVETLTAAQLVDPVDNVPRVATADQAAMLRALDSLPRLMATVDAIAADVAELRQIVLALASPATLPTHTIGLHTAPVETHPIETHVDATVQASPPRRRWWRFWYLSDA